MEISSDQALDALEQVQDAQRRISVLRGYGFAAQHFLLWGCIWVVGFTLCYLLPAQANRIWMPLDLGGFTGSLLIVRSQRGLRAQAQTAVRPMLWRFATLFATYVGFTIATYRIFEPHEMAQFAVFPGLLTATIYINVGLWRGLRWVIAGLVLAALALTGYFLLRQYLLLWMAVAGGGTLLTTGFWLRHS